MPYKLTGTYVGHCDCRQVCPCAVDGPPTGRDGQCHGLLVHEISEGNLDETDLSGVKVVMAYHAPSNISAGNLRIGLIVDDAASDEQAAALEQIFSGNAGGMFGEFKPLFGEFVGVERRPISFTGGEEPSATVGDTQVNFEAFRDAEGNVTTMRNAAFGFAPEFTLGKSSGTSELFGDPFEASYGEAAEFEYA